MKKELTLTRTNRPNENGNFATAIESSLTTWIRVITINWPIQTKILILSTVNGCLLELVSFSNIFHFLYFHFLFNACRFNAQMLKMSPFHYFNKCNFSQQKKIIIILLKLSYSTKIFSLKILKICFKYANVFYVSVLR